MHVWFSKAQGKKKREAQAERSCRSLRSQTEEWLEHHVAPSSELITSEVIRVEAVSDCLSR